MNVVQYNDGIDPIYNQCINQVKSKLPDDVKHTLIDVSRETYYNNDIRTPSNVARFREACKNPDMLWLDADMLCIKWLNDYKFESGFIYWALGQGRNPNNWAFYVNNRCDIFQEMMQKYDEEKPSDFWWFHKKIQALPFKFIPKGYFLHLYWNGLKLSKGFKSKGNSFYQIKPVPGNGWKLDILIK